MKTIILAFALMAASAFGQGYIQFVAPGEITTKDGVRLEIRAGDCFPLVDWEGSYDGTEVARYRAGGLEGFASERAVRAVQANRQARDLEVAALARMRAEFDRAHGVEAGPAAVAEPVATSAADSAAAWGKAICDRLMTMHKTMEDAFFANNAARYAQCSQQWSALRREALDEQHLNAMRPEDRLVLKKQLAVIDEYDAKWSAREDAFLERQQQRMDRDEADYQQRQQTESLRRIEDSLRRLER